MPAIDILMAAYNGERYISEQIESILSQTFTDWRLLIRDDGSTDNTSAIIEDYAAKYPGKIEIIHDDAVCKNSTKNFFELLKHAEADYVMFSDQDDVWLPYKVQITYDYMKKAERDNPGKPIVVFTGMQAVDSELKSIDVILRLDLPEYRYTFKELLADNCVSGCTQILNRECYEGMGGFQEGITYHDYWASLYASAFGTIVRVPMALMLYRQHGDNVVGGGWAVTKRYYPGGMKRVIRILKNPMFKVSERLNIVRSIMLEQKLITSMFRSRFYDRLDSTKKKELDDFCRIFGRNILARYSAIRKTYCFREDMESISRLLWVFLPRP